jgi:hypothetical protein
MQCTGALPIFIIARSPTSYYSNVIEMLPIIQSYEKALCVSISKRHDYHIHWKMVVRLIKRDI